MLLGLSNPLENWDSPPILTHAYCCIIHNWPPKTAVAPCALSQEHPHTHGCPSREATSQHGADPRHRGSVPTLCATNATKVPILVTVPWIWPPRAGHCGLCVELPLSSAAQKSNHRLLGGKTEVEISQGTCWSHPRVF